MNKLNKMVLLSALTIVIIGTIGTALAGISDTQTVDLLAGGDQVVGNVTVYNDSTNIYVKYMTFDDWLLNETHVHVAEELVDIPQTNKGNPTVGQFNNSTKHEPCVDEYIYTIPLSEIPLTLESGTDIIIAAHAALDGTVDETTTYESAWGNGTEFADDRNWAMYIIYRIP